MYMNMYCSIKTFDSINSQIHITYMQVASVSSTR